MFYGKGNDFKRIKFDRPIKLIAARGRLFVFATEFQVFNEDCQPIIPPLENGLVICQLDITETEWIAYCDNPITNKFKKRLWAECVKGELTDVCLTFASNYDVCCLFPFSCFLTLNSANDKENGVQINV